MIRFFSSSLFTLLVIGISSTGFADAYNAEWENIEVKDNSDEDTFRNANSPLAREQAEYADQIRVASSKRIRRFHEVLDELLAEFGYDVRMGQMKGLQNLSVRKVEVSNALPKTYSRYVELLVAERIRENSRIRLVSCVPCRSKTSRLVEGRLMITSPTTNLDRMRLAANQLGIDHFMDVILVYHTTHMVLAVQVFNTETQELTWARTYNSETIRSRYQKLAIDYKQVAKSRPGEDYQPEYRYLVGLGGGIIPNINGNSDDSGMVSIAVRGTEKFDNRKHEFGLHFNTYLRKTSILGEPETNGDSSGSSDTTDDANEDGNLTREDLSPFTYAIGLYGLYARHFVGPLETYNRIRHAFNAGLGFLAAPAYITPSLRAGWDIYFGKRFALNLSVIALSPSSVFTGGQSIAIDGGVGGELTVAISF